MNCLLDSLVFIVFYNDVRGCVLSVNKQALTYIILSEYGCPDVFFQIPLVSFLGPALIPTWVQREATRLPISVHSPACPPRLCCWCQW